MMKSKRKAAPSSPLARFWREFLFTREFEFVIHTDPEGYAKALKTHFPYMYITKHTERNYSFVFYTSENGYLMPGMVNAVGTLEYDDDQSATILQGQVQFDMQRYTTVFLVGVIFMIVAAVIATYANFLGAFVGILVLIFALWWWMGYQDRNRLIGAIHQAVTNIRLYNGIDDNNLRGANSLDETIKQKRDPEADDVSHPKTQNLLH